MILAFVVLILVVVGFVFSAAMPAWLPLIMIGLLAVAVMLIGRTFPVG